MSSFPPLIRCNGRGNGRLTGDAAETGNASETGDATEMGDATETVDAVELGDDVNHLPPSPTPITQLVGDAPDDDNLDHDNDAPDRNHDDDATDDDDEDTVFNSVICQHTV